MRFFVMAFATLALTACQAETQSPPTDNALIGAYIIVNGKNYDVNDLAPYAARLPPIYEKYGGEYVAFAPNYDVVEGSSESQAIIISAWPSVEAAKNFWNSAEYTEARKLREGIGEFDVVIVPAISQK